MPGPAWKYKKTRGCRNYNPSGTVSSLGPCEQGSRCGYVHPDDPEWPKLQWRGGVGRLQGTTLSRSRSRSRDVQRSRSREGRYRSPSRERDAGWGRKRAEREWEKERERGGPERAREQANERSRSRDRSGQDRDRSDWGRPRRPASPARNTRRRLSSPRRRHSYHDYRGDKSPPWTPISPPRPRRDSFASNNGGDPTSAGRARTPRSYRRNSSAIDTLLLRSPEEQKPDLRELERVRLQEIAQLARELCPQEGIDLPQPSAMETPTAASPLLPNLSGTLMTMSSPPPPPPAELPPPMPDESPLFAPPAMMNVDYSPIQTTATLPQAPDVDDVLQDDQILRGGWDERIHLLTELVELSTSISALKDELEAISQLAEASTTLPEDARRRMRKRIEQAEAELHAKQAEYERLRDQNARASRVWPISDEQIQRDMALMASYNEMVKYLAALVKVTRELQEELGALGVRAMPIMTEELRLDVEAQMKEDEEKEQEKEKERLQEKQAATPLPTPSRNEDEDPMEVDSTLSASSPLPPSTSASSSTPSPLTDRPPPAKLTMTRREFDEISSRLDILERDLNAVDDVVCQRENELRDEFTSELESREQDIMAYVKSFVRAGRTDEDGGGEDEKVHGEEGNDAFEDEGLAVIQTKMDEIATETMVKRGDVDGMTEILENFQARLSVVESRAPDADSEYQAALQRNADLHARLAALEASDRSVSSTMETLQNTLRAHMASQPPSPPSSPPPIASSSLLLHILREPLKTELRRGLMPIVEDVRAGVQKQMEAEVKEVYGTVWERTEGAVRVVGAVERVLMQGGVIVNGVHGKEGVVVNGTTSH